MFNFLCKVPKFTIVLESGNILGPKRSNKQGFGWWFATVLIVSTTVNSNLLLMYRYSHTCISYSIRKRLALSEHDTISLIRPIYDNTTSTVTNSWQNHRVNSHWHKPAVFKWMKRACVQINLWFFIMQTSVTQNSFTVESNFLQYHEARFHIFIATITSSAFGLGLGWGTFGKACLASEIMNLADFAGWKQVLKTPHYYLQFSHNKLEWDWNKTYHANRLHLFSKQCTLFITSTVLVWFDNWHQSSKYCNKGPESWLVRKPYSQTTSKRFTFIFCCLVCIRDVNRASHRTYAVRFWNILPRPNRAAWVINFCPRVSAAYRVEI